MGCCVEVMSKDGGKKKISQSKNIKRQFKMYASIVSNNITQIKSLIKKGYKVNQRMISFEGKTPLHIATEAGSIPLVIFFLEKNTDINCTDDSGVPPLFIACQNRHFEIVELFLKYGAKTDITTKLGSTLKNYIPKDKKNEFDKLFRRLNINI